MVVFPMTTVHEIKEKIEPVAEKYNIPKIYLFGSFARGDEIEDSDIDLVYEAKGSKIKGTMNKRQFKQDLERSLGKPVDIIRYEAIQNPGKYKGYITRNFEKEKVTVFEKRK